MINGDAIEPRVTTPETSPETTTLETSPETTTPVATESIELETGVFNAPAGLVLNLPVPDVAPGTILDSNEIMVQSTVDSHKGYNILYASRSLSDEPIAVTGFIIYPDSEQPEGGWPLLSVGHGSRGLADDCSTLNAGNNFVDKYKLYMDAGYAMVFTDYEGLGTPGRHAYLVGESEARGMIDAVRAVQDHNGALGDLKVTDEWFAVGNSQGGHATAFVSEIWQDYAPELDLMGAMLGAPPQPNILLTRYLEGDAGARLGYIPLTLGGYDAVYPEDRLSERILSDEVLANDHLLDTTCAADIFRLYGSFEVGDMLRIDTGSAISLAITHIVDPGRSPNQVPVIIVHGTFDTTVPVSTSQVLFLKYCNFDNARSVIRNTYEGVTHSGVINAAAPDVMEWMDNILAGQPAPTDCQN